MQIRRIGFKVRRAALHWLVAAFAALSMSVALADHGLSSHASEGSNGAGMPNAQGNKLPSLLKGLGVQANQNAYGEFLDPDIAFVPTLEVVDATTILARWEIADDYYLYRDKFRFRALTPPGTSLGDARFPPGKVKTDEFFGEVEVYYGRVEAAIPVQRASASEASELTVEIGYQGCADAGLCYPPMTRTLLVALPAATSQGPLVPADWSTGQDPSAAAASPDGAGLAMSEQDRIAGTLAGGAVWLTVLSFYGFGLLLAFTPCVLPMVPILSSIIAGQGATVTTGRAFRLSLTFVLAMAVAYTAAGMAAGLTGANLQAALQAPWILISISILFVLLALAMFGLYELQLPSRWQSRVAAWCNRQRGGTYLGVGAMGLLSALIVGPCVAAPLAGALIYISQTGDAALGGGALFAMSLGMGTPILAIGASAGKWLPKAGPWMDKVKAGFGFLLLGVAIYMLERLIAGWVAMFLWAALLIYGAVYVGALDALSEAASGWRRLAKGTGLILLVYGFLLMVGGAGGGNDVFRPLRGVALVGGNQAPASSLEFKQIKGLQGLQRELRLAGSQGRPVMLDFYADWCITCKELEKYTFSDPKIQGILRDTILLQSDVTSNDHLDQALLKGLGLYGPPAILFFGPDGRERAAYRLVGYMDAELFRQHARAALDS